jgi:hypothetical protein
VADTNDPRLLRLRVELYTAAQICKGEDLEYFKDLVREVHQVLDLDGGPPSDEDLALTDRVFVTTTTMARDEIAKLRAELDVRPALSADDRSALTYVRTVFEKIAERTSDGCADVLALCDRLLGRPTEADRG